KSCFKSFVHITTPLFEFVLCLMMFAYCDIFIDCFIVCYQRSKCLICSFKPRSTVGGRGQTKLKLLHDKRSHPTSNGHTNKLYLVYVIRGSMYSLMYYSSWNQSYNTFVIEI